MACLLDLASEHPYVTVVIAAGLLKALHVIYKTIKGPRLAPPGPPNTVVLHGSGPGKLAPSLSPYTLKLQTYLHLAKIPHVVSDTVISSSKGKLPWISYNDDEVDDSQLCIEYLNKKLGIDLNKGLTNEQRAVAHALRVLIDEYTFWANTYFRLKNPNDPAIKHDLMLPVRYYLRHVYKGYMNGQGMGRHSEEQILNIYCQNLRSLEDYLGDKRFLMGDEPTEVDCSVFGLISQLIFYPPESLGPTWLKDKYPKLHALCLRIKERAYPDWESCLRK